MALRDALWLENAGAVYNAGDYRRLLQGLDLSAGVNGFGDLKVTEQSPAATGVLIATGTGYVEGTEAATQGFYFVANDAAEEVALSAADPTNDRIDLVGILIEDDEYSGVAHIATLHVVEGIAAGSPVEPTPPDNFLTLAAVTVPGNAGSISNSDIEDRRVASSIWARPRGRVDAVSVTSGQTLLGTEADLTGLSIAATLVEGRRYEAWVEIGSSDTGGKGIWQLKITNAANAAYEIGQFRSDEANVPQKHRLTAPNITGSGAQTIKARGQSIVATVVQSTFASSSHRGWLVLEDVGGYVG